MALNTCGHFAVLYVQYNVMLYVNGGINVLVLINQRPRTFYDIYIWYITPKLKKIDLVLKTAWRGISHAHAAELLEITDAEVVAIMREEGVESLNKNNFARVMRRGSSEICRYVDREYRRGSPFIYSPEDVAYIYDLDQDDVRQAFEAVGVWEASAQTLPMIFTKIPARG